MKSNSRKTLPKLPRISELSVLEKKAQANQESPFTSKAANSTGSSTGSCHKVAISPLEMEEVAKASTEANLRTRTSPTSTLEGEFSQWPTLDQIRTDLSSSSALKRPLISMANTSFLERSSQVLKCSTNWKRLDKEAVNPQQKFALRIVVSSESTSNYRLNSGSH